MLISLNHHYLTEKPAGNDKVFWRTFNDAFEAEHVSTYDLLLHVAKGGAFAPVFDGKRSQENFTCAQHIGLDFDHGATLDKLLAHPVIRSYAGLIYPTPSHTPDQPRYRVVIPLAEPIHGAKGYHLALRTLHQMFPAADQQCVDVSRMFYGNSRIEAEGLWEACYTADVEMPLADLRLYAKRMLAAERGDVSHRAPQRTAQRQQGMEMDEVFERLASVDPYAMTYDEWQKLGSAIGHTFGEGAFWQFKRWSDKPGKAPLTWKKWQSMCAPHANPAGMGTIVSTILTYGRAVA